MYVPTCLSPANWLLCAVGDGVSHVVGVGSVCVAVSSSIALPATASGAASVTASAGTAAAPAAAVAAVLNRVRLDDLVVHGRVVLLREELADSDEAGDCQGHEGSEQSLLGDQGDHDVSETGERGQLQLQPDEERQQRLHQLLLLASSCGKINFSYNSKIPPIIHFKSPF